MHPVRSTVTASDQFCLRNRSEVHAISESEFRFETAIELLSAWSHLILQSWLLSVMRIRLPEANKKLSEPMNRIARLLPAALIEDVPNQRLTKAQIGTVVESLQRDDEAAPLVEFSDEMGQTYAMAGLKPDQLLALHRNTEAA
jgi:Domain of unknown function (DUF4926)